MKLRRLLPRFLRAQLPVAPDPRDAELAAAILDDGRFDPAWLEANTRRQGAMTVLPDLPRIVTPHTVELATDFSWVDERVRGRLERQMDYDRQRFPKTFARLEQTAAAARDREQRASDLRARERAVGDEAASEARERFRAGHADEYQALGLHAPLISSYVGQDA